MKHGAKHGAKNLKTWGKIMLFGAKMKGGTECQKNAAVISSIVSIFRRVCRLTQYIPVMPTFFMNITILRKNKRNGARRPSAKKQRLRTPPGEIIRKNYLISAQSSMEGSEERTVISRFSLMTVRVT